MTGFKKRVVTLDRVAQVEAAAASSQIIGDPRTAAQEPVEVAREVQSTVIHTLAAPRMQYLVGQTYEVPLGQIKSNPFNPRFLYTNVAVDNMATSLSQMGQITSATGFVSETGEIVLIEGETRLRGCRASGRPTLKIEIKDRPVSDIALYEEARAANVERRDQTPLDDSVKWKELLAKKVYQSQAAVARALGLDESYVSRIMSLNELPPKVIQAAAEWPALLNLEMLNAIREYHSIQGEDKTLELVYEAGKNSLGYRDVRSRRTTAEKGPIKRTRSNKEVLTFNGATGELKSFEEDGRIELSLKGLTPEMTEEIRTKLREIFVKRVNP
jgi:ParB family chromosome partitioning protein